MRTIRANIRQYERRRRASYQSDWVSFRGSIGGKIGNFRRISLSLSLSLYRFHSTGKFPTTRNVRIAISDKWHFRYFCAIQSSDACQRVWLMETNEAGSGIIRKRPGDEIINWNYGGGGGRGVGRNRTTLISSVLFTISRQNGDRDWAVSMLIML